MKKNTDKQPESFKLALLAGCTAAALVFLYGLFLFLFLLSNEKYTITNAGVFGDSFGVLTSLFSALAFAGVIYTNTIQREQYNLQKIELQEQKIELENNRKESYKQGFENTFFQMLRLLEQTLNAINYDHSSPGKTSIKQGRTALKFMENAFRGCFKSSTLYPETKQEQVKENIVTMLNSFNDITHNSFNPYIRVLESLLKFISESDIEDKSIYAQLVKAQLSEQELFFIFYNSLSDKYAEIRKLISTFKIMQHLEPAGLLNRNDSSMLPHSGAAF